MKKRLVTLMAMLLAALLGTLADGGVDVGRSLTMLGCEELVARREGEAILTTNDSALNNLDVDGILASK